MSSYVDPSRSSSRRRFVRQAGIAGLALGFGAVPGTSAWARLLTADDGEQVIPFTDVPADFTTKRGDAVGRMDLRELRSWTTPVEQFFAVQHYNVPTLDASMWRLETTGLVGNKHTFSLDDLKKRRRIERTLVFECSGNRVGAMHGMVGNSTWGGASLADVLRDARPGPEAREAIFWAADQGEETIRNNKYTMHFARSMSLDEAMRSDAILAYEMNGQPLTVGHGFPIRLIVPGWYGVANVKWLTTIELSDTRFVNRFMGRDYVTIMGREAGDRTEYVETSVGRQHVKSVIARVTRTAAGHAKIFGAAWTGSGTSLANVDVRVDNGEWQRATLDVQSNPYAWTFFTFDAGVLTPGEHKIVSRATDRLGHTQPAALELKKTYWEDNAQFTRTIKVS